MSKISREENKKRYKTGMYPTQQDFENVFDSYVHKDDTIDPSQVMSGDENIIDIINRKAEERHSHEMKDVNQLPETIQEVKDDIKQAEDDIAEASNRIDQTENVINNIETILGKKEGDEQTLKEKFAALGEGYSDIYTFINTVKSFLKDADASDKTINRWKEIEAFLSGITDTQNLTTMLANLKEEILQSCPKGNFLEQVEDLDAYTDAPDGKIVQYIGQTNEQYKRGFIYERKSNSVVIPQETWYLILPKDYPSIPAGVYLLKETVNETVFTAKQTFIGDDGIEYFCYSKTPSVGDYVYKDLDCYRITDKNNDTLTLENGTIATSKYNGYQSSNAIRYEVYENSKGDTLIWSGYSIGCIKETSDGKKTFMNYTAASKSRDFLMYADTELTLGESSWQPIKVQNVID